MLLELFYPFGEHDDKQNAVEFSAERFSYPYLLKKVLGLAQFLQSQGIQKKERVAIFISDKPLFIILFFALEKIGAITITFNTSYKENEIASYLKSTSAQYLVCDKESLKICRSASKVSGVKFFTIDIKNVNFSDGKVCVKRCSIDDLVLW